MNCPKCNSRLKVTHTYSQNNSKIQRLCCSNPKCLAVVVAETLIVSVDPPYGEGATRLLKGRSSSKGTQT